MTIILAIAAATGLSTPAALPVEKLISLEERADDQCRGGSGNAQATWRACARRDQLIEALKKRGVCWGPASAIGADQHWINCADNR